MLIEFTLIEKRRIAINPKDVLSVEQGDYLARYNNDYGFDGCPTKILIRNHGTYTVRESFDTVKTLLNSEVKHA